jgi:hypothetical protein
MEFYSYLWLREDGTPYYAGKGKGRRAFTNDGHRVHCPTDRCRILIFPQETEADAFESEIALIDLFGRKDNGTGCLRNLTNGGENPPKNSFQGHHHSEESRKKISRSKQNPSADTREKMAVAKRGRKQSAEQIEHMAATKRGKPHPCSAEQARKASLALKGKPWSAARRQAQEEKKHGVT